MDWGLDLGLEVVVVVEEMIMGERNMDGNGIG